MNDENKKSNYIGFDLGQVTNAKLTNIIYTPRNDDNGIRGGSLYELFYWKENEWASLGLSKGTPLNEVSFACVPTGALYLLKDISGGSENRIFTYENGIQNFW